MIGKGNPRNRIIEHRVQRRYLGLISRTSDFFAETLGNFDQLSAAISNHHEEDDTDCYSDN